MPIVRHRSHLVPLDTTTAIVLGDWLNRRWRRWRPSRAIMWSSFCGQEMPYPIRLSRSPSRSSTKSCEILQNCSDAASPRSSYFRSWVTRTAVAAIADWANCGGTGFLRGSGDLRSGRLLFHRTDQESSAHCGSKYEFHATWSRSGSKGIAKFTMASWIFCRAQGIRELHIGRGWAAGGAAVALAGGGAHQVQRETGNGRSNYFKQYIVGKIVM